MDQTILRQSFENYKNQGNQIMLRFEMYPSMTEKVINGQEAIDKYENAFQYATGKDEKASAKKNCGFAAMKIGQAIEMKHNTFKLYWFTIAASYYKEAYFYGSCKDSGLTQEWKHGIIKNADMCLRQVLVILSLSKGEEKIEKLEVLENFAHSSFQNFQRILQFVLAQSYYIVALKFHLKDQFKEAAKHVKFAYQKFCKYQQYKVISEDQQAIYKLTDLTQLDDDKLDVDISQLEIRIWAAQEMKCGNEVFNKALTQEENLQMDLIQNALDHYTTALERGKKIKDDEIQAEAQSMIGQIMYKVIKDSTKAFTYFFKTIEISDKFENSYLKRKPWFIKSQTYFEEINNSMNEEKHPCYIVPPPLPKPQQQVPQEENPQKPEDVPMVVVVEQPEMPVWMMQPQNFAFDLARVKEEYDQQDYAQFLQLLEKEYKTDEWNKSGYKLEEEELMPEKLVRTVMKVIKFYHPDKQNDIDVALKKFYSEITKCLTTMLLDIQQANR
ncbi:hypothetical protein FGO68_gene17030 [Halteria grandinella]|uniref:Uncharacterized protein n=1 Tax=Halteria grandinella TaxID=5974 RepID=A0A8J8T8L4_HALGN|nr:hypothetical protein FGO68_gene17030 [Halteria grandinella]